MVANSHGRSATLDGCVKCQIKLTLVCTLALKVSLKELLEKLVLATSRGFFESLMLLLSYACEGPRASTRVGMWSCLVVERWLLVGI